MVAKKRTAPQSHQTTLRHLWLASLGLAAVARREAAGLPQRVLAGASQLQHDAAARLGDVGGGLHQGLATARAQVEPKVVEISNAVERRLAPVLVKFGLKPAPRPVRKGGKVAGKRSRQVAARKAAPASAKGRRRSA